MPRRFLLWDHDGALVDTERWYFEANRAVLRRQLPETRIDTLPDARLPRPAAGPVSSQLPLEPQVR